LQLFQFFNVLTQTIKMRHKNKEHRKIEKKAIRLIRDPRLLYRAGQKIGYLGIVGEERNRLVLTLGCVARTLPAPPSLMLKGPPGTGKSTLAKTVIQLFPPHCVVERAGLSGKALAHRKGSLARKILYINEYRCGKDSQLRIPVM
jgi:hypothetical protein